MAGVKGRSGGPRPNSGGKRVGAGRKPKAKPAESANLTAQAVGDPAPLPVTDEPLAFLLAVQNHPAVDIKTRVRAAIAAAQYKHTKRHDGGKKEQAQADAVTAAQGTEWGDLLPLRVVGNGARAQQSIKK